MNDPAHRICYTYDEFLALEASSNVKHEFLAGQIYGMAGGTPEHAALAATIIGLLFAQLRGKPCRLYDADLRVRVPTTGLATYPDVSVVCGAVERDAEDAMAATNPTVLIEVLSRSSEDYDRGDKFEHYKRLGSLQQYVLVDFRTRRVEVHSRGAGGAWNLATSRSGEQAALGSIDSTLDVDELYDAANLLPSSEHRA